MEPVRIYVEPHYIRAAEGGTGFTKCAGNYAGAALAGDRAEKMGFNQVLWLDGHDRKYVEEMGSMNGFFVIGGELYTAAASSSWRRIGASPSTRAGSPSTPSPRPPETAAWRRSLPPAPPPWSSPSRS